MNEDKMLKRATAYSMILMTCVITFSSIKIPNESISYAGEITADSTATAPEQIDDPEAAEKIDDVPENKEVSIYDNLPYQISDEMKQNLGADFIAIEKPKQLAKDYSMVLDDLAVDRQIVVTIHGIDEGYVAFQSVHRFNNNNYSNKMPSPTPTTVSEKEKEETEAAKDTYHEPGLTVEESDLMNQTKIPDTIPSDIITAMDICNQKQDDTEKTETTIKISLNKTYAYLTYEDEHYFYIALKRPQDVYDKILVLDAGHGGTDSGTYSKGEKYLEKDMNLDMLLRLQEYLLEHDNIKIYTTRTTDRRLTLNQRVNLANDVEADLFLSIHCNANVSSKIHGTEVLYNDKQNDWETFNSKKFAQICLEEVTKKISLKNRGIVPRSKDVHIIGESKVPVALVEVAFMSNKEDLDFLTNASKRQLAAEGIYHGIMRALDEMNTK